MLKIFVFWVRLVPSAWSDISQILRQQFDIIVRPLVLAGGDCGGDCGGGGGGDCGGGGDEGDGQKPGAKCGREGKVYARQHLELSQ